uniref:Uncharacterized protein n=1 Tax=uncultured prokaryote TaxID=198431 RepID=A0A0H5PWX1_9ZZZZ|nr:hypothetical protein [uncultured prokaryote]
MSIVGSLALQGVSNAMGSAISGISGSLSNAASQRRAYRYAREWRDNERAYNTPASQRDRLEAAGYNINALGGAATAAGSSNPMPSLPSGTPHIPAATSLQDVSAARLQVSQSRYYEAQADLASKKSDTEISLQRYYDSASRLAAANASNVGVLERLNNVELWIQENTKEDRAATPGLQNQLTSASIGKVKEETDYVISKTIEQMNRNSVFGIEREKMLADLSMLYASIELTQARIFNTQADTGLKRQQMNVATQLAALYIQQAYDLERKNGTDYWTNMSDELRWNASESRRRYKWAPVMNVVGVAKDAVGMAADVAGIVTGVGRLNVGRGFLQNARDAAMDAKRGRVTHTVMRNGRNEVIGSNHTVTSGL